jgi:hypothetical protein
VAWLGVGRSQQTHGWVGLTRLAVSLLLYYPARFDWLLAVPPFLTCNLSDFLPNVASSDKNFCNLKYDCGSSEISTRGTLVDL